MSDKSRKTALALGLQMIIATFFIIGLDSGNRDIDVLYRSYFADLFIPFSFYFLLTLSEHRHPGVKKWWVKALSVFVLCSASETLQFFGIFALARIFDPIDFVMYGAGVTLAALVDRKVLAKAFSFWD
ncbi:hypothetical protein ACFL1A_02290 [Patescibacteria group bacterium]